MPEANPLTCKHSKVVRRRRRGLLDALMFRFGRFPWSCQLCGRNLYFANRRPGGPKDSVRSDVDPRFGMQGGGKSPSRS